MSVVSAFDLVITDNSMPGKTGRDVAAEYQGNTPIVLMKREELVGVKEFVQKPMGALRKGLAKFLAAGR